MSLSCRPSPFRPHFPGSAPPLSALSTRPQLLGAMSPRPRPARQQQQQPKQQQYSRIHGVPPRTTARATLPRCPGQPPRATSSPGLGAEGAVFAGGAASPVFAEEIMRAMELGDEEDGLAAPGVVYVQVGARVKRRTTTGGMLTLPRIEEEEMY
eukprot:CAMPEP_0184727624 /NCGR_PEP_ID=MMETSP0314-20130426/37044_1 /TAXON_ID=38298 /ORGANISM="Rhodella maculata, Strain CCMP 736" /LENGTH=153 /DNA_ID=CAMNT_0027193259 /DNA_START=1 /DNA_END=462 /DNA_ORIENTATION=-